MDTSRSCSSLLAQVKSKTVTCNQSSMTPGFNSNILGCFSFDLSLAVVYKGAHKGQNVAIKKLKDDSEAAQSFLSEASVMTYVCFISTWHSQLVFRTSRS